MKGIFSEKFAIHSLITILLLVVIFHVFVMTGIIPFNIVMGGRLNDSAQMLRFESIALLVNLVMLFIVLIRAGFLKINVNSKIIRICFWTMFVLFLLNSIGNLFSNSLTEKIIFTPLTIFLSLVSFRLALYEEKE